MVSRSALQSRC